MWFAALRDSMVTSLEVPGVAGVIKWECNAHREFKKWSSPGFSVLDSWALQKCVGKGLQRALTRAALLLVSFKCWTSLRNNLFEERVSWVKKKTKTPLNHQPSLFCFLQTLGMTAVVLYFCKTSSRQPDTLEDHSLTRVFRSWQTALL